VDAVLKANNRGRAMTMKNGRKNCQPAELLAASAKITARCRASRARRMLGVRLRRQRRGEAVAEQPVPFAGLLRGLRAKAGLTQEELAEAAGLTSRVISDLERGMVAIPHKDTVRLLAEALQLGGGARVEFETTARHRALPGRAGMRGVAAARTLPRDISSFTGRQRELAELADAAASRSGVVSIHAIGGMAGIGKTAFAVHAAHQLASQFPGGQIFLPLHGHTPGRQPVSPADALASLLLTIGIPAGQIPADAEARTGCGGTGGPAPVVSAERF
jgi:transcriptional regulator with XRE-family HTH domain